MKEKAERRGIRRAGQGVSCTAAWHGSRRRGFASKVEPSAMAMWTTWRTVALEKEGGRWLQDALPPSMYSAQRFLSSSGPRQPREICGDSTAPRPPPSKNGGGGGGRRSEARGGRHERRRRNDGIYVNKMTDGQGRRTEGPEAHAVRR